MESLKYAIIKTEEQYYLYCNRIENLLLNAADNGDDGVEDEIELLALLIEKWDESHNTCNELNPIQMLKALMKDHSLLSKDLAYILNVSKSLVSSILNYRRGLSKENIRKLALHFKLSQEAFNQPYKIKDDINKIDKNSTPITHKKEKIIA